MNDQILIDGIAFPARPKSNAPDEQDRKEEDLIFGAVPTLHDLVNLPDCDNLNRLLERYSGLDSPVERLMFFLKLCARHYGLDSDAVLEAYIGHYFDSLYKSLPVWTGIIPP